MRTTRDGQKGLAAAELALMLPLLVGLLLFLVEGANAMRVYSVLSDASREGARMVLREGDPAGVPGLVENVVQQLPDAALSTVVSNDAGGRAVTVEVSYEYQSFLGLSGLLEQMLDRDPVFTARTTMPLP